MWPTVRQLFTILFPVSKQTTVPKPNNAQLSTSPISWSVYWYRGCVFVVFLPGLNGKSAAVFPVAPILKVFTSSDCINSSALCKVSTLQVLLY